MSGHSYRFPALVNLSVNLQLDLHLIKKGSSEASCEPLDDNYFHVKVHVKLHMNLFFQMKVHVKVHLEIHL